MNRVRSQGVLGAVVALAFVLSCWPATVSGQVGEARFGQRFRSVGFASQPGLVLDEDREHSSASWGSFVTFALHHVLHPHLVMAAELGLGMHWLDEHGIAPGGEADEEKAFAWQVGLMGRYLPMRDLEGLTLGAGLHIYGARLDEAPMQQLAGALSAGWIFWRGARRPQFALVELGVALPIVQGLRLPDAQVVLEEGDTMNDAGSRVPSDWSLLRSSLSIQVSF